MRSAVQPKEGLNWVDMTLLVIFLLGIYLSISVQLTKTVPFPNAPSGIVGIIMLWRQRHRITQLHVNGFLLVFLIYLASVFAAPNAMQFFGKRFTGLVQITYSFVLGYAMFMTITQATRKQMAKVFLIFSVAIALGCLLENYAGLREVSNAFRRIAYKSTVFYDADIRDIIIYGRIRPKLFTSEPSYVTFAYAIFCFAWFMFSEWRWKIVGYLAMVGAGQVVMPGPTLLLALAMVIPYELFMGGRSDSRGLNVQRVFRVAIVALLLGILAVWIGMTFYSERLRLLQNHGDASFFFRETGPALVAKYVIENYSLAGVGLTGEQFVANAVVSVFQRSPAFAASWATFYSIGDTLVNYFWLHWIYLGLIFGLLAIMGLYTWLRLLGVASPMFAWAIWAIMGQSLGAYVGPRTWFVFFLAAAGAALHEKARQPVYAPRSPLELEPAMALARQGRAGRWPAGHPLLRSR
jgi:hypothetical protein